MEQGNEGDAITLLALRQIDCPIPDDVLSVGQLTPDLIVDVVARSLWLMTDGEAKFPVKLPPNIALRHRVCTEMATKIKELGYPGDCGYNQLLYPVESQTKTLLTWLVQKLPRSEEERAEEVLGANALLNKRIVQALSEWKQIPWRIPCTSKGTKNIYSTMPLRTFQTVSLDSSSIDIFAKSSADKFHADPSIFEKHTLELITDAVYASRLENDFDALDAEYDGAKSASKRGQEKFDAMQTLISNSISAAKSQYENKTYGGSGGSGGLGGSSSRESKQADQLSLSLQDLIQSVSSNDSAASSKAKMERGTRFMHATEFAQETSAVIGDASSSSSRSAAALAAAAAGMDAEDAAARKARQEKEEKEREVEIEGLRAELQGKHAALESKERSEQNMNSKARQMESELSTQLAESEALEREIILKKKTLEMLPMAAENIGKLQTICSASAARLLQLAQEWEVHRRPLVEKVRLKKKSKAQRKTRCRLMVEEIKKFREEMVTMIQELKDKQERVQVLGDEMKKLPRNINRALYTHRIMDIIASIAKQNKDIDKITTDIREIQKTINSSTSSLQRADAVAEELVYAAANGPMSDKAMVDTYRRLRTLRAKFDDLITTVSRIGQQEKLCRDLETKIDQETARVSTNNFDRIKSDLEQVQTENAQLVAQIKAATRR